MRTTRSLPTTPGIDCAKDPRFNADNLMREIELVTDLSFVDRLIYRFLLVPITKKRLLEREAQFKWIYRTDFPDWGRGRDDAMNLTKYFYGPSQVADRVPWRQAAAELPLPHRRPED